MKQINFKWSMVNLDICPRCGRSYNGSYCPCEENDLGDY